MSIMGLWLFSTILPIADVKRIMLKKAIKHLMYVTYKFMRSRKFNTELPLLFEHLTTTFLLVHLLIRTMHLAMFCDFSF